MPVLPWCFPLVHRTPLREPETGVRGLQPPGAWPGEECQGPRSPCPGIPLWTVSMTRRGGPAHVNPSCCRGSGCLLNPEEQVVATTRAPGSLIHDGPTLQTTQMPINRQMDKHNVVFLYSNVRLGNKKE